jgi:F0F1-type ATP synthase beta subunit
MYASLLTQIHMYIYIHTCIYICIHTLTGEPIDERGPINAKHSMSIHADAPSFAEQSTEAEILVTGIKVLRIFLCRR